MADLEVEEVVEMMIEGNKIKKRQTFRKTTSKQTNIKQNDLTTQQTLFANHEKQITNKNRNLSNRY